MCDTASHHSTIMVEARLRSPTVPRVRLTLFHAVLLGLTFGFLLSRDPLDALFIMVLSRCTLLGVPALCKGKKYVSILTSVCDAATEMDTDVPVTDLPGCHHSIKANIGFGNGGYCRLCQLTFLQSVLGINNFILVLLIFLFLVLIIITTFILFSFTLLVVLGVLSVGFVLVAG